MTRGRHRRTELPPVLWNLSIPADVAARVSRLLEHDAVNGRPAYSARASLVVSLLLEWLSQREALLDKPIEV